jgi:hypothetical protein
MHGIVHKYILPCCDHCNNIVVELDMLQYYQFIKKY